MSKDCREVFTDIYQRKVWGDGSGGGSGEQALPYCQFITNYMINSGVYTVLDIGCGDLRVARNIDFGFAAYIGVEASTQFRDVSQTPMRGVILDGFDVLTEDLPAADLVLCKEVLQHLSNEQVQTLLDRTAHYKRRLFTNSVFSMEGKTQNDDIETGDFRPVDLTLPPFNAPAKTVFKYGHWIVQEL